MLKKFKKLINGIKIKKNLFWIIQIIVFMISFLVVQTNILLSTDLFFRKILSLIRNNSINITKNNITLVALDENFFEKEDTSSAGLHRGYYAQVLKNILSHNPSLIVIDVFFEKKHVFSGEGKHIDALNTIFGKFDDELAKVFNEKVILSAIYDFNDELSNYNGGRIKKPDEVFLKNNAKVGHVHSIQIGGINVGIYSYLQDVNSKEIMYPLGLKAYMENNIAKLKKNLIGNIEIDYNIVDDPKNNVLLMNFANSTKVIPRIKYGDTAPFLFTPLYITKVQQLKKHGAYISFYDAYKNNMSSEQIKDKIIFIGATDIALNDMKATLLGTIPGVLNHINQYLSLENDDYIYILKKDTPKSILQPTKDPTFLFIMGIIIINSIVFKLFQRKESTEIYYIQIIVLAILLTIGQIFLAVPWISKISNIQYSIFLPLGTLSILLVIQIIFNLIYSYSDTYNLKDSFQRLFKIYVGSKVEDDASERVAMIEKGHKKAQSKEMAIFFSDIAGFTNLSEKLSPEQNIAMLNKYLEEMTKEIINKKGIVDKFIGDAIMAYWDIENGCEYAARSAIGNIINLKYVNKLIKEILNMKNQQQDLINIRIGLHYGKVIHGDLGYSGRLNETIIGDNVNLASRLESINKYYKTSICISKEFRDNINNKSKFIVRKLDKILVKGKEKPVEIYELVPIFPELLPTINLNLLTKYIIDFEQGLSEYFKGNFEDAKKIFEKAIIINPDETAKIFIQRCNDLIINPPNDWNGVWKHNSK